MNNYKLDDNNLNYYEYNKLVNQNKFYRKLILFYD